MIQGKNVLLFSAAFALASACTSSVTEHSPLDAQDARAGRDAGPVDGGVEEKICDPFSAASVVPQIFIGPTGLEARLTEAIEASQSTIDLMMYQFTRPALVKSLSAASGRGVAIRVVIDARQTENAATVAALKAAGVDIRAAPARFSHNHSKVLIVDKNTAFLMSANFNDYSMASERNYGLVVTSPQDVGDLQTVFDADFAGVALSGLDCTRLILSPANARDRLGSLIGSAEKTLDLAVMYLSDAALEDAVIARHKAGVSLRILFADPGWIKSNSETAARLKAEGISVRYLSYPELHAKLIVADDRVFIGSQNLSWTSLEKNREVGLIDTTQELVGKVNVQFDADWNAGKSF
jgi:phosphatidylserine/phosphatidylglycerophosphate/cardiolipin synthase-like enzyme